jgi:hypothetical protein
MALERIYGAGVEATALRPADDLRWRSPAERAPGGPRTQGGVGTQDPPRRERREAAWGDVPPGTDAQAWLSMSVEERAYFARLEAAGPLAYGPGQADGEALYRGRYINIKV